TFLKIATMKKPRLTPVFYRFLLISVSAVYIAMAPSNTMQENSTPYFSDVTQTHLPIDPKLHSLDAAFDDVDGDGDLDIIIAVEDDENRLYINDGTGRFNWKKGVVRAAKNDTEHVRLADFNNDGKLDIIFVSEDDHNHELYFSNGDGSFQDMTSRIPAKSES